MSPNPIVINFKRRIKEEYFTEYLNVEILELNEEKENNCKFKLLLDNTEDNHFLIIKDLEKLKVESALYIHKDYPKDCDYVIIDLKERRIYFIELKNKKNGCLEGPSELRNQLISGEKWIEHLFFCANIENLLQKDNWKVYWATLNYRKGRPTRKSDARVVHKNSNLERVLPIFEGNTFLLKSISKYK